MPVLNPYLDAVEALRKRRAKDFHSLFQEYREREDLTRKYAWAIPNEAAIACILKHSPLIEIGAGTGYWASLLEQAGADIVAYDILPPDLEAENTYHDPGPTFTEVHAGDPSILRNTTRALFLCWPPYNDPMAKDCLRQYSGNKVIYVGEGGGGCTGDDKFHRRLDREFNVIETVRIPQWQGIHDYLWVYQRKV